MSVSHQSGTKTPGGLSNVFALGPSDSSDQSTFMLDEELEFDHGEVQRNTVSTLKRYPAGFSLLWNC